jgi:hypothetical protein
MLFVTMTHSAFLGLLKTYCTGMVNSDWMITEYTHDEKCDIFTTLGACNSQAASVIWAYPSRYPGRRHADANMFRRLEQRLCETRNVIPRARVNAGRPRTVLLSANEGAIIGSHGKGAVVNLDYTNRGSSAIHDDELYLCHYSRSAHLCPDNRPLWIEFCDCYDIDTLRIKSCCATVCGQMKRGWVQHPQR